jgi:hypothetical protein
MLNDERSAKALSCFLNLRNDVFDSITALQLSALTLTSFVVDEVWKAKHKEEGNAEAGK